MYYHSLHVCHEKNPVNAISQWGQCHCCMMRSLTEIIQILSTSLYSKLSKISEKNAFKLYKQCKTQTILLSRQSD